MSRRGAGAGDVRRSARFPQVTQAPAVVPLGNVVHGSTEAAVVHGSAAEAVTHGST